MADAGRDTEKSKSQLQCNQNSYTLLVGIWDGRGTGKTVWLFLIKLNVYLPHVISKIMTLPSLLKKC